ncbi:heme peroxidase [Mycena galopus ATCC 62051]|nr:heme peroxidase [Mycena galopus ATCC 62051]
MFLRPTLATVSLVAIANAYVWPSPQLDALESARFVQEGFDAGAFTLAIQPCDSFLFAAPGNSTGRTDASDWIRTAYHDMATHNSTDGTGGLDASIRFAEEQQRPENRSKYSGGPEITFRGGRVDATVANAPGVPEPQQDLDSHIASFARQGFTQTEMIGLVACGHTFGGVQHIPFPDIVNVLNDSDNTLDVAHFDSTFFTFDNNVATEYISGTTQNPLVVGFNDTTNSDKRIFGSDGNATMLLFANSLDVYTSTCADLFARMIDTVPSNVNLTDVITPLPVKPSNVELVMNGDILQLGGQVRLWNMTTDPTRTVTMLWKDHIGGTGNASLGFAGISTSTGGKYSAAWYGFNFTDPSASLSLDPAAGVISLSFVIDGRLEDQGGLGFAIQDGFMFSQTSCQVESGTGRFDVAVRNGLNPTRVYLEESITDSIQRVSVTELNIAPPSQPIAANSAYTVWSINVTAPSLYGIGAEIDGVKYSTTAVYTFSQFPPCQT